MSRKWIAFLVFAVILHHVSSDAVGRIAKRGASDDAMSLEKRCPTQCKKCAKLHFCAIKDEGDCNTVYCVESGDY
ncbi:hypothetical protein OSTOST_05597 [Ostertagia ostertagi]